jgi:NTE family protein
MSKLLALLLLPIFCFSQNNKDYKNLVLEGGGIRGMAYAGVFTVLEQKGILQQIEKVGGSSAGAIAGMMVSIGYTATEIDSIMMEFPVEKLNDGKGGLIGKYKRVKHGFGIYKGEAFEKWLQQIIAFKTGDPFLSFEQLHQLHLNNKNFRDFYCTGTNVSKQQLEVFSFENSPRMPVELAVRISSCIPFYFEPVILDDQFRKIKKTDTVTFANYYIDGGTLSNYPINMFDTCEGRGSNPLTCDKVRFNKQTLGIKLERPRQIDSLKNNNVNIPSYEIKRLSDYAAAFGNLIMETINRRYPGLENEKGRTIYVSQGNGSPKIKKTKKQDKLLLYENGVIAANEFLLNKKQETAGSNR